MMKNISAAMHTKLGQTIVAIILGIGLASLFRKTCSKSDCYDFKAPPTKEILNTAYQYGDGCYEFTTETKKCSSSKQVNFA